MVLVVSSEPENPRKSLDSLLQELHKVTATFTAECKMLILPKLCYENPRDLHLDWIAACSWDSEDSNPPS